MMPSFDIAGRGKIWFIISLLVIVPGLISMVTRGFNFRIDCADGYDLFNPAAEVKR